jgi:hypothetical protein
MHENPAPLILGEEEIGHEHAVRDEFKPGECKPWHNGGLECVECSCKGCEDTHVAGVEDWVWNIEILEEVKKEAEIGSLVKCAAFGSCVIISYKTTSQR